MLEAQKEYKDVALVARLIGSVDDDTDLEKTIGSVPELPPEIHLDCGGVTRINSVGVKGWVRYFNKVKARGIAIRLQNCSPPIVQQINSVFNFTCGGVVESVQLSFACEKCEELFVKTLTTSSIKAAKFQIPDAKCPKCGGAASFDDIPKVYFKFLMA